MNEISLKLYIVTNTKRTKIKIILDFIKPYMSKLCFWKNSRVGSLFMYKNNLRENIMNIFLEHCDNLKSDLFNFWRDFFQF